MKVVNLLKTSLEIELASISLQMSKKREILFFFFFFLNLQPTQTPLSLLWGTRIAKSGADPVITLTVDLETSTPLYKRL